MPPKNLKKGKSRSKSVASVLAPVVRLMSLDEMRAREMKYTNRLVELRPCLRLMDDASLEIDRLAALAREEERWNRYIRCDGLPKPFVPPEIRRLFVKLSFFEEKTIEKTMDWLLSVDERSVLSQDIFAKDLTRKTLFNAIRPNFGKDYESDIITALKVLKSIEYYLEDEKMVALAEHRILYDIRTMRRSIIDEIRRYFNRFAYRILCSEDSYMDSVNAITAEYSYACEAFIMHMWTIKNVPILFRFLPYAYMRVGLSAMHCVVVLPYDILEENLTLRALHCAFDHYSENAKDHTKQISTPMENMNGAALDIHECLVNEWALQMDMQNDLRNKMIERRRDYEEKMGAMLEEKEKKKKEADAAGFDMKDDKNKKRKRKEKVPKEPPLVTDDTFPDIYQDFLDSEQQRYEDFLNICYNPKNMNMAPSEINMKDYVILGGIYQFDFVEKPLHYQFNNFNMTWHMGDGELVIKKDIIVVENESDLSIQSSMSRQQRSVSRLSRMSRVSTRISKISRASRMTMKKQEAEPEEDDVYEETTLFIVNIELPQHLCLWGEPQPCHFVGFEHVEIPPEMPEEKPAEPAEQTRVSPGVAVAAAATATTAQMNTMASMAPSTAPAYGQSIQSTEGMASKSVGLPAMHAAPSALTLTRVGSITPRGSLVFQRASMLSNVSPAMTPYGVEMPPVDIDDFRLDMNLAKFHIRNIQRHCIPRMISSFKFPKETAEDEDEEQKRRSKNIVTLVKRRRLSEDEEDRQQKAADAVFSFDNQTNPERIFPHFAKLEPLPLQYRLPLNVEDDEGVSGSKPLTFSNFIGILDEIKRDYRLHYREIMKAPPLKKKTKIPNLNQIGKKAIKPQIKRKDGTDAAPHDKKGGKPSERRRSIDRKVRRSVELKDMKEFREARDMKESKSTSKMEMDEEKAKADKEKADKEKAEKSERIKAEKAEKAERERLEREKAEKEKAEQDIREKVEQAAREVAMLKQSVVSVATSVPQTIDLENIPSSESEIEEGEIQYPHWTKRYMKRIEYDFEKGKITLYTDRLGIIGFAYKRYEHFPFRNWSIGPSAEKPETEVVLNIETQYVIVVITISNAGYCALVTETGKVMFEHKRIKYLNITEPIEHLKELKRRFLEKNLNIFVDNDTSFYIENGHFSEKHLPAEMHTYSGIALHTLMLKFARSPWNYLSKRRDIILKLIGNKEPAENMVTVRITPEETLFVDVSQVFLPEGGTRLDYNTTWRNLDFYVDLHNAIISMYPGAGDSHIKDARLINFTRNLLCAIRPLSYS